MIKNDQINYPLVFFHLLETVAHSTKEQHLEEKMFNKSGITEKHITFK